LLNFAIAKHPNSAREQYAYIGLPYGFFLADRFKLDGRIKMNLVQLGLLCLVITLASCSRWNVSSSNGGSSSSVANNAPRQWSPMDFREAYIAAKTESARRDVFLRALDEG
jgi:hypothetical protein